MLSPPRALLRVYRKMLIFRGRASRAELNWFLLAEALAGVLLAGLSIVSRPIALWLLPVSRALFFAPMPALIVRRLHDCNLSGWWIALYLPFLFLPKLVGFLALLLLMLLPGSGVRFANAYGDPERDPDFVTPLGLRMLTLFVLCAFYMVVTFLIPQCIA